MELIKTLLEHQPLMALFLTIAIGYLVGEINIKGFSLGVGAVLFVALAVGWFAPKSAPAAMVGTLGLALFLYAVGVQYGKQFFLGLTSAAGLRANVMALLGVLCAGAVSLVFVKMMGLELGHALGLFAGSGTSTPTLQAAIATLGNDDPAVGYSVSYPFGVAGPILFLYIVFMFLKPKIEVPTGAGMELLEIALRNPELSGKTLGELMSALPAGVQIVALRRAGRNEPASPNFVIAENDVVLATAPPRKRSRRRAELSGEAAPGRLVKDRRDLDYLRVFASRPTVVGRALGDLDLPGDKAADPRPGPPRRHRHPAAPRSRARVRRSRRRARPSRRFRGDAQVLRRLDQGHRRVQLHLHRHRHGARLPDRRDPASASRHRQARGRAVGRADHGADPRQPAPHRRHELDHPAFGQPRAAQPRAHAVPRPGRHVVRAQSSLRR